MIWLNPLALVGLVAVAAPILIHILVQRRAERFPFSTLRFIQPTRLAAIRRHVLEDAALLAVRAALVAAAAAALAGPLIVTAARRHAWDRRIVRALVFDDLAGPDAARGVRPIELPFRSQRFEVTSLPDGVRRASAWLESAPPARRELVVVSPFAIGSITAADVAAVPSGVGIRFERKGSLPATRSVSAGRVLSDAEVRLKPDATTGGVLSQTEVRLKPNTMMSASEIAREVTLNGSQTIVRDKGVAERASWPIDVRAPIAVQPAVNAATAAVLSQRVWAPPPDRRARLVLLESAPPPGAAQAFMPSIAPPPGVAPVFRPALDDAAPIRQAWMADAVARIARDAELQAAASRVATGFADARFSTAPWQTVASATDGRALAVAAGSPGPLIVVSAAGAADIVTPLLMRSIVNGLASVSDLQSAEVVPIPDRLLKQWSRPSSAPAIPGVGDRNQRDGEDDRRWFWLAVLCLLAVEMWMRRGRASAAAFEDREEAARVA